MNTRRLLFMSFLFLAVMKLQGTPQNGQAPSGAREIQVTAKKYDFSPDVIRVKKGEHVKLVVTATDRDHGIKLDAFHIDQKLKKGEPTTIEFTPNETGTFPFKCSVVCGIHHGRMKGTVVVEE